MSGELTIQSPEQRALQARQTYMSTGPSVPLAQIPAIELQTLCSDVEGVRLPDYAAYDVGWLELETALSTYREHPTGGWNEHYAPAALLGRAQDRWEDLYANHANSAEFRSKAEAAVGSLVVYRMLVTEENLLRQPLFSDRLLSASQTLLRAYDRHNNVDLLPELHNQTLMLLLNYYFQDDNLLAVPTCSRMQDPACEKSFDMILLTLNNSYPSYYNLRVAAQTGGAFGDSITIPPEMLNNQGYEPQLGQGTLRAVQEQLAVKKPRLSQVRKEHMKRVHTEISRAIREQLVSTRGISFEADAVTGLDEARQWYQELHPNYRFVPADKAALEGCINAHEYALGNEELAPQDAHRLGWLWLELASLPDESDGIDRAEQVFELSANTAEEQEDWPAYLESQIGIATARLYRAILAAPQTDPEALVAYKQQLTGVAEGLLQGLNTLEPDSSHLIRLQAMARDLAAALLISSDDEFSYLGVFPSPRQAAESGWNVSVTPEINSTFQLRSPGKIRFDATDNNSLERGIATLTPRMLIRQGWTDELEVLRLLVDKNRFLDQYDAERRDSYLDYLRTWVINTSVPTQSI